jgi:hypothetical protein
MIFKCTQSIDTYNTLIQIEYALNKKRGLFALSPLRVADCYCLILVGVLACDCLHTSLNVVALLLTTCWLRDWHSLKL